MTVGARFGGLPRSGSVSDYGSPAMSWLGMMLVLIGVLVIAAPLGWIGLNKLQEISDDRYKRQQKQRQSKS
ncbi:MAG: hypothetical protein R3285_08515 [Kiloniellales bacterium]|nr:hypothetical protein [Kiloniellales bacterium]